MKCRHPISLLLFAVLGLQLACSHSTTPFETFVPATSEPLALTLRVRSRVAGERLPAVKVSGLVGSVRVEVARLDLACTLAQGSVGREPGVLTFVARVGGDPSALCASGFVVEYAGVIGSVAPGRYTVHVFEAVGDGLPQRLGTRTVTVPAPTS